VQNLYVLAGAGDRTLAFEPGHMSDQPPVSNITFKGKNTEMADGHGYIGYRRFVPLDDVQHVCFESLRIFLECLIKEIMVQLRVLKSIQMLTIYF
jgi:hypothetical protein